MPQRRQGSNIMAQRMTEYGGERDSPKKTQKVRIPFRARCFSCNPVPSQKEPSSRRDGSIRERGSRIQFNFFFPLFFPLAPGKKTWCPLLFLSFFRAFFPLGNEEEASDDGGEKKKPARRQRKRPWTEPGKKRKPSPLSHLHLKLSLWSSERPTPSF